MSTSLPRPIRLAAVGMLLAACGCAAGEPFRRPSAGVPLIRNEADGRTYSDCRRAFAAAGREAVLVFSEGVFSCGDSVETDAEWLVIRGAGAGRTFLEAAPGADAPPRLTRIRPGLAFRAEDLAFGGLLPLPSDEARATLVRVAIATEEPALFGSPEAGPVGSVLVVHSVLAATAGRARPELPRPLAFDGNERVAVIESVLLDVEQEFERYPAPGSILLLSRRLEQAFAAHRPAAARRRDASDAPNVPCGHARNPQVACQRRGALKPAGEVLDGAARLVADGRALRDVEPALHAAAAGFAERFRTRLAGAVRQPALFWFDHTHAVALEEAAAALGRDPTGREALAVLARQQSRVLAERCGDDEAPMTDALQRARAFDRLLPAGESVRACAARLQGRAEQLVSMCSSDWGWDGLLEQVAAADEALHTGGAHRQACLDKLRRRVSRLSPRSPLVLAYLREVSRRLDLGLELPGPDGALTLAPVTVALPRLELRRGRALPLSEKPTVLERLLARMRAGPGDGRLLLETTEPCRVAAEEEPLASGATGLVRLAERLPNAPADEPPRTVAAEPVEATRTQLDGSVPGGMQNVVLQRMCDESTGAAWQRAVARYVREELARLAVAGTYAVRLEAELALLLTGGRDGQGAWQPRNIPALRDALAALEAQLALQPVQPPPAESDAPVAASPATARPAPEWTTADFAAAADLVARAPALDLDSCARALPLVPWKPAPTYIDGPVVLAGAAARLRCRIDPRGFELSVWVEDAHARPALLQAFADELLKRIGPGAPEKTGLGTGTAWRDTGGRCGFVFARPAQPQLGWLVVPLGSAWPER